MIFFFYIFALLAIVCSIMVIFSKNSVHSVFWLIGSFINSSSLMVLIGAEFIAMLIVIIYVGAIAVLFLFVIMMLSVKNSYLKIKTLDVSVVTIFLSLIILLSFFISLIFVNCYSVNQIVKNPSSVFFIDKVKDNIFYIAKFLYSDYLLVFQISGIILLVSIVAAISITFVAPSYKKQKFFTQLMRTKHNSVKLMSVKNNSGVSNIKYE